MNISGKKLVFFDVETTGLSPDCGDRVCEIGILQCNGPNTEHEYRSFVNPERSIAPEASAVNGITDEMVKDAPLFCELVDKLLELFKDAIIVCHNAPFDMGFLEYELKLMGRPMINNEIIDTLGIARKYFRFPSNSLPNIAGHLDIKIQQKHRALADVHTTYKILMYFLGELSHCGFDRIEQLIVVQS